jgi:hypothetical protein
MVDAPGFKYRGFISYSRADESAVSRLHRRLEKFVIPPALRPDGQARLGDFFRERSHAATASMVSEDVVARMRESQWMIVCCSPAAVESDWVAAEIEAFIGARGRGRILAIVLDGEPRDVLPPILRVGEPLAADFRRSADGDDLGLLKLIAAMLDVDVGELRDRLAGAERGRTRARTLLAGAAAATALAALGAAGFAVTQNLRAQSESRAALDVAIGMLERADAVAQPDSSSAAVKALLDFADERLNALFDSARDRGLDRRRLAVRLRLAEAYGRIGDVEKQGAHAEAALAMLDRMDDDRDAAAARVRALAVLGEAVAQQGDERRAGELLHESVEAARGLLRLDQQNLEARMLLADALQRQGGAQMAAGGAEAARPLFAEAVAALEFVVGRAPGDDAASQSLVSSLGALADAQAALEEQGEARATMQRAVAQARAWSSRRPDSREAREALGFALMRLGQIHADAGNFAAARAPMEESLAIARAIAAPDPAASNAESTVALRLMLTANVLLELRQAATPLMVEATEMGRELVARDPENAELKEMLARMLAVRAARLSAQDEHAEARDLWREIVTLRRQLRAAAPPNAPGPARDLALALERLGAESAEIRDASAALGGYNEAVRVRRELVRADPENVEARRALATTLHTLGLTRKFNNNTTGAIRSLTEAAELRLALVEENPRDRRAAYDAADSFQQAAVVQAGVNGAAARRSLERARAIVAQLVSDFPNNARYAEALRRTDEMLQIINTSASN